MLTGPYVIRIWCDIGWCFCTQNEVDDWNTVISSANSQLMFLNRNLTELQKAFTDLQKRCMNYENLSLKSLGQYKPTVSIYIICL